MKNAMRTFAWLLLVLVAPAVQAQMYKCTEGGKTRYSDKPITDCKDARTVVAPPPKAAEPTKPAAAKKAPDSRPTSQQAAYERKYQASRCKELREEERWLLSPRGQRVENQATRLGQVRQALSACR